MTGTEIMDEKARNLIALMDLHGSTVDIMHDYWLWIWLVSFVVAIPVAGIFFFRLAALMQVGSIFH